ncbi:hypothetical protein ES703_99227 [subsurface metagenome]
MDCGCHERKTAFFLQKKNIMLTINSILVIKETGWLGVMTCVQSEQHINSKVFSPGKQSFREVKVVVCEKMKYILKGYNYEF